MITLQNHVDFLLKFTLAFGAVFELPLALTILARIGIVNSKMLAKNRSTRSSARSSPARC
jgi:sec-independent protein translocase protein TatC